MSSKNKKALITGSFDPMTMGHFDVIRRAAGIFDDVTVGIIVNPNKNSLFTKEERIEMVKESFADYPGIKVDAFEGLLADYVNENGFDVVIRGLRTTKDFEYEFPMTQMNDRIFNKGVETLFLMTSPEYGFVSSSMVKEVAKLGGNIEGLVPENVLNRIIEKYKN